MASFAITFRVDHSGDYQKRYESIVSAINDLNTESVAWDETTSFLLIKSGQSADSIATSIYLNSDMNSTKDKLLVMQIGSKNFATQGNISYPNSLAAFFF